MVLTTEGVIITVRKGPRELSAVAGVASGFSQMDRPAVVSWLSHSP